MLNMWYVRKRGKVIEINIPTISFFVALKKKTLWIIWERPKPVLMNSGASTTVWSAWNKSQFRHSLDFHLDSCRDKHTFFRVSFPAHKLGFCCWWSRKENICWKDWSICYISKLENLRTLRVKNITPFTVQSTQVHATYLLGRQYEFQMCSTCLWL